jgi:hypothetical protein
MEPTMPTFHIRPSKTLLDNKGSSFVYTLKPTNTWVKMG